MALNTLGHLLWLWYSTFPYRYIYHIYLSTTLGSATGVLAMAPWWLCTCCAGKQSHERNHFMDMREITSNFLFGLQIFVIPIKAKGKIRSEEKQEAISYSILQAQVSEPSEGQGQKAS